MLYLFFPGVLVPGAGDWTSSGLRLSCGWTSPDETARERDESHNYQSDDHRTFTSSIVNYIFNDPNQFFGFREAHCLFPESLGLVANDEDARVAVFRFDVLISCKAPNQHSLFARQEYPTWTSVKSAAIFFESRRRIGFRIDTDRNEECVFFKPLAKRILDLFQNCDSSAGKYLYT